MQISSILLYLTAFKIQNLLESNGEKRIFEWEKCIFEIFCEIKSEERVEMNSNNILNYEFTDASSCSMFYSNQGDLTNFNTANNNTIKITENFES